MQLRIDFFKSLPKEFETYFPNGALEDFEIFVPEKLPRIVDQALTHGLREIQTFAERFELNALTLLQQVRNGSIYCSRGWLLWRTETKSRTFLVKIFE